MYGSGAKSREYEPSWRLLPYQSIFSVPQDIKSGSAFPFNFFDGIIIFSNQTFRIRDGDVTGLEL